MLLDALRSAPPGAIALVDGQRAISYGDLPALIGREIEWLRAGGAERHALLADNGVPWALADLALHVGEMLAVPLPGSFTPAQVAHALDDAGVDTVLADDDRRTQSRLPGWRLDGSSPVTGLHRFRRQLDLASRAIAPPGTRKITYTSGSTANPKGVCLAGMALEAIAESVAGATRELTIERHLCILPLATLLENVAGLYAPLLRGATCVVPPSSVTGMSYGGLDATRLLETLSREQPDSLILVPELLQVLVVAAERGWQPPASLQFVAVGGARVSGELLARADAAGIPVHEGYGLSECASVVCLNTPAARRAGTVGRPLPHVRVRVDAAGQVHVAGNAMLGYLGDPPRAPLDEVATGDLGVIDADGYLRLQGRIGNRFITGFGRNVSPEWVECEISQRLGGRPVLVHGEARPYVVALVGASAQEVPDAAVAAAIAAANAVLPNYAQVRHWARPPGPFTPADGTLTANGRLRRQQIQARFGTLLDDLYRTELAS
jgi:long-subunit acyl-CoA synthetase (AMP-forming)